MKLLNKIFGTKNERDIKKLGPRVQAVNALESSIEKLDDAQLRSRLGELKVQVTNQLKDTKKNHDELTKDEINAALDPISDEAFAIVREASKRVLGMRHYDVQLIGGMVLNSGRIAEMKTGEGKTLVATLPAVLNTLSGGAVHVITVNDYLATRDAEWMGRIYRFLGLEVGVVFSRQGDISKQKAYQADITYGQNNEFGFDYLRDNMKFALRDYKQRGHTYAIIDEVDSILIDEARTPLIISGPAEDNTPDYVRANKIVPQLRKDEHYTIDEKSRSVLLTEQGVFKAEQLSGLDNLYDPTNIAQLHHLNQALKAHALYKRDTDYVVDGGEVIIVDEHTGRLMPGRRWSDGLHGAIEAKENVKIQNETQTLATVTFQNYFRMYQKLSGMTGTADTEAEEFAKTYDLDTLVIPTNKPIARIDDDDLIFKTELEKFNAIADDIEENHGSGTPILVGTTSVERSEVLSRLLKKKKVEHNVLNAKLHRQEAGIVAQAGKLGRVTIATNMAGRGTDILLGGNPEYMARTEVAAKMHETDDPADQVAEFAFLSGRADLINVERLAEKDKKDGKFVLQWEERIEELRQEAEDEGKPFVIPEDMPQSVEEVRERVYEERLAWYREAVRLYEACLPGHEAECKKEKEKVLAAGGLRCIGTERHESRRIDNQLRGRAGRQGDPGSSRFYLSLEDDLMRIFGSDKMIRIMETLGMEDGVPIEHKMVTKSIANAQKRVEGMHFDSRKNLVEYDDVNNHQRKAVYSLRKRILENDPAREEVEGLAPPRREVIFELAFDLLEELIVQTTMIHCPEKAPPAEWKVGEIEKAVFELTGVQVDLGGNRGDRDDIMDKCFGELEVFLRAKAERVGEDIFASLSAFLYLQTIDARWKEHLQHMDHLREGIHMRAYGQKDPKQEYKKEGYNMFLSMRSAVRDEVLEKLFRAEISTSEEESRAELDRMRRERRRRNRKGAKQQNASHPGNAGAPLPAPAGPPMPRAPSAPTGTPIPVGGMPSSTGGAPGPMPTGLPRGPRPPAGGGDAGNRAQRRRQKSGGKKRVRLK
jgi:preprotein translocase subunit SecA